MRPQGGVALQGQFLAGPRRVMVGTRGVWRGGAIADLCLPPVRVGCRGVRSGVDAHTNPGTSIGCNRTPRCRGEAKSWPYRPRGTFAPGSRDCIPGWWNWPYRPQSQGQRLRVCTHFASTIFEGDDAFAVPGHARFRSSRLRALCIHGAAPLAVLVHLRHTRVSGL
jgi:hypothetical protein